MNSQQSVGNLSEIVARTQPAPDSASRATLAQDREKYSWPTAPPQELVQESQDCGHH
jgi:hypothetical protein